LARKTVLVCDNCSREVGEGKGATMRMTFSDARRGAKQADLCDNCAAEMPGRAAARRGRRPKAAAAA
jgi:ribosomal protein S26